jgi:hypothetical protein
LLFWLNIVEACLCWFVIFVRPGKRVTEFKKCKEGGLNVVMMCCLVVVQLCKKDPTRIKRNSNSKSRKKG